MAQENKYVDQNLNGNKLLSVAGLTDAAGNPIAQLPTVASYSALPTSGPAGKAVAYYVQVDERHPPYTDPAIYILFGSAKAWLPLEPQTT